MPFVREVQEATMLERFRRFDGADQIGLFDDAGPSLFARLAARLASIFR